MRHPNQQIISTLRDGLIQLPLDVSHKASTPPKPKEMYAPRGHQGALDPDRSIVVGNRGVGKSFWSGALIEDETREVLGSAYPKLKLGSVRALLGFSGDDYSKGAAPSAEVLRALLGKGFRPETIWRAVFLKALDKAWTTKTFEEVCNFINSDPEAYERVMLASDRRLRSEGIKQLLVFDALDRLGDNWQVVRDLTRGLMRLALSLRSYSSIRAKIFVRPDQGDDQLVFDFPDASKIRAERVELRWSTYDLYGLLYSWLANSTISKMAFLSLLKDMKLDVKRDKGIIILPEVLKSDESTQALLFSIIAGEFMGSNHRRGRTYTWLPNHLGDAHGQTAPRTFLTALKIAAEKDIHDVVMARRQAIDHHGIKEGVQKASQVRLDQLAEDHVWIRSVLASLSGMEVPTASETIIERWRKSGVVRKIRRDVEAGKYLGPLELQTGGTQGEHAVLDALTRIGVTEERSSGKINIPDIFRVAASLKRRGGIKPPGK